MERFRLCSGGWCSGRLLDAARSHLLYSRFSLGGRFCAVLDVIISLQAVADMICGRSAGPGSNFSRFHIFRDYMIMTYYSSEIISNNRFSAV